MRGDTRDLLLALCTVRVEVRVVFLEVELSKVDELNARHESCDSPILSRVETSHEGREYRLIACYLTSNELREARPHLVE